jgi:hypothetical protein
MTRDIVGFVKSCAYCKLTNATSLEAHWILQGIETQAPFDELFLDVWTPRDFPSKWGEWKMLTCLEGMSSFAEAVFIDKVDSTTVWRTAFTSFFIPNGLPKLINFDTGSKFSAAMTKMCTSLGIPYPTVAKENHKAILNEPFHTNDSTDT